MCVSEAAKGWLFPGLSMLWLCRGEGSKDPRAEQLAARGWPLAVAMVWNFPVLRIFRQQHTYKCVVKLDACRGRLGPPGLLTKPMFQWRSKFDFSPPSLSSSFSFPSSPHPSFAKEASVTGEKN